MSEKKKLSGEALNFFKFMNGPAVMGKINRYTEDNKGYDDFKKAVESGDIAFILAYGASGWVAYGTNLGIQKKLFNIIQSSLQHEIISEKSLCSKVAFICATMHKKKGEKNGKEN